MVTAPLPFPRANHCLLLPESGAATAGGGQARSRLLYSNRDGGVSVTAPPSVTGGRAAAVTRPHLLPVDDYAGFARAARRFFAGILCALASQATADTVNIHGTTITLRPAQAPGALAEVEFRNVDVNSEYDNGDYDLTGEGLAISVTFVWDAAGNADAITLAVPEGVVCAPDCRLALPEGASGVITLYALDGVGM